MANKSSNAHAHLTEEERHIILTGITNGSTKAAIAETLGKDKSTIGKEIKAHRFLSYKCALSLECANYKHCTHDRICKENCLDYIPFKCNHRDRSPGVCNGCKDINKCRFNKYKYDPADAHHDYRMTLVSSREGFNITTSEVKRIGTIMKPLLDQGQSVYSILADHPEIGLSVKTIYTYIENGLFKDMGIDITVMSLRRQVKRKITKKKSQLYKKREDRTFLKGRTYKEYLEFIADNPDVNVVEMDTVYNDVSNGPFIQTFKFVKYHFLIAFYHTEKTAEEMVKGVNLLEDILGEELFSSCCQVLLTDRGSEFSAAECFEHRDGQERFRTRVFYCDPMAANQKGSLENNHIELRYILPKECNLYQLGLNSQEDLNLVISNVNSVTKELLDGKSPMDLLEFMNPKLYQKLIQFGLQKIDKDKITLKPYLLKNKK